MIYLVVDGYNIIGAWEELQRLKEKDIGQARDRLLDMMAEYQAYSGYHVIVVFDAYFVKGKRATYRKSKLDVIFTKENETADECIERLVKELQNVRDKVYVATSDYDEQRTIFGSGALRKSARELYIEMEAMQKDISRRIISQNQYKPISKIPLDPEVQAVFEKWRRGRK
ncbi:hypothetical protein HNQ35_002357 [Cerasibacillus quisquiliarum]|uniref:NYN domain-containing protein n=1 Tax=Cerasibacillus quisquiliarum TaxID=227865 RepID=A0A511UZ79_9BACI|nr:NYN domain-containing protein [Cerasibacillus quisquiliarum]MBB5147140.1 hypothetical protein [Cerasibacillus quisquiliarum]GEN31955.1 hypothetical protein CQU01_21930 [Cerasibacillus quisquiliarum]